MNYIDNFQYFLKVVEDMYSSSKGDSHHSSIELRDLYSVASQLNISYYLYQIQQELEDLFITIKR